VKPSLASADVKANAQFKSGGRRKVYVIFFAFVLGARWTEVPLLPDDFFPGRCPLRQPSQHELLSPGELYFFENQPNDSNCLRVVEKQTNGLNAWLAGPPSAPDILQQGPPTE